MSLPAYWEVAVAAALPQTLTYKAPQGMAHLLEPGLRVLVPLGRRLVTGYLLGQAAPPQGFAARDIADIPDSKPLFPKELIAFFRWIGDYYFYPLGQVIKEALPSGSALTSKVTESPSASSSKRRPPVKSVR